MSSFDQSRGFSIPSSLTRQDHWAGATGDWGHTATSPRPPAAPPLPSSSSLVSDHGFQHFPSSLPSETATPARELDYSVIDDPAHADAGLPSNRTSHGFNHLVEPATDWQLARPDKVSIDLSPHLEGTLLQKHHVWVVVSNGGKSSTERRYSDFVWLLDCLSKRYPFRLLPSLPPKSIQYQGHFIGQDEGFLERRKRGLERCLNALVNHPVLSKDGILSSFLNEQSDLTATRKGSNVSLAEESTTFTPSPAQLSTLPADLDTRFTTLRNHLPVQIDTWTKLSITADRIAHRRLNQAHEFAKLGQGLDTAVELEDSVEREKGLGWRPREMKRVDQDLNMLATGVRTVVGLQEGSSKRLMEGWVEDVKRHRELYTNLRDLFHRQSTLGIDYLDKFEKRLASNAAKLDLLQSTTPAPSTYATDFEKLSTSIETDKRSIEALRRRREFIRWCVWQEVQWVFRSTSLLRRNMRDFVQSELRFGTELAQVWTSLDERGLGDD
ncbi:uncharacterized protein JCM15063_003872 [Sporobolomyces koalae]|uniref:uncharacterized protein n=1 Tax=Sporobolomyces koalae TaxID=500713 RepID=UPI00317F07A7